jgi:hypothetical protein
MKDFQVKSVRRISDFLSLLLAQRKKIRTKIFATRGFASAGLEITGRGSPGA